MTATAKKTAPKSSPAASCPIATTAEMAKLAPLALEGGERRYADAVRYPHVLAFTAPRALAGRRFGVGAVPVGQAGNRAIPGSGGAVERTEGPWAYVFGLASVIDNAGGTGAEIARNRAAGVELHAEVGDLLEIEGVVYRIDLPKFATSPELVAIARSPEAA